MALTFQPFKDNVALEHMREELWHNLGPNERCASIVAGVGLLGSGLCLNSWGRAAFWLAGAAMLYRGATGHCGLYEQLQRP